MGAPGFGENAWIGFGEETTYGGAATRTKFIEILSENIRMVKPVIPRGSLRTAGRRYFIPGKKSVEGGFRTELLYEGFEKLFKHLFGTSATSALSGGAFQHTFSLAAQPPIGLTIEVNRDLCAWVYEGCQIASMSFENAVDGVVQIALELLGEDETTAAASSPNWPGDKPVHWGQLSTLTFGAYTLAAENARWNFAQTLAGDRYKLGTRTRKGLGRGGRRVVNGSFTAEFEDVTLYNDFLAETERALTVKYAGATIGAGNTYALTVTFPRIVIVGEPPAVAGPGPIKETFNFEAFYDVTNTLDEIAAVLVNTTTTI